MSSGFTNIKYVFEGTNGAYRKTSKSKDLRALSPLSAFSKRAWLTWWHMPVIPIFGRKETGRSTVIQGHPPYLKSSVKARLCLMRYFLKKKSSGFRWLSGKGACHANMRTQFKSSEPAWKPGTVICSRNLNARKQRQEGPTMASLSTYTCTGKHMYPNMHTQRQYPRRGKEKGEKSKDRSEKRKVWEEPGFHSDQTCFTVYLCTSFYLMTRAGS